MCTRCSHRPRPGPHVIPSRAPDVPPLPRTSLASLIAYSARVVSLASVQRACWVTGLGNAPSSPNIPGCLLILFRLLSSYVYAHMPPSLLLFSSCLVRPTSVTCNLWLSSYTLSHVTAPPGFLLFLTGLVQS